MRSPIAVLCIFAVVSGCREADGPADPSMADARVYLTSSPNGAEIRVDNQATGNFTPDTIALRRGDRAVVLRLDSAGFLYNYGIVLEVGSSDSVPRVHLPLGLQCAAGGTCFGAARRHYDAADISFAASAVGSLFNWDGSGLGLFWPAASQNSYLSSGMPVFAGKSDGDSVSLGVYDQSMLVGRPAPMTTLENGTFRLEQLAWIVPPPSTLVSPTTVRGIEVREEVIGRDALANVLIVRLTFRNISDEPLVHLWAPHIPAGSVTYTDAFIGLALDPDIGTAGEDWVSYDADLDMVFAYDADFQTSFSGSDASQPGLLGLRVLEAPVGTSVVLNSWYRDLDWAAGRAGEDAGYAMLSGTSVFAPDHPAAGIGFLPPTQGDVRMSVTAGPLTLAPGDEATIVMAVAIATPTTGTFTSGTPMEPGDPLDTARPLYGVAAALRATMVNAESAAGN